MSDVLESEQAEERTCTLNVSMDKLQAHLLRSCKPAVRKSARAARGHSNFRNEVELKACVALAKLASSLLYARAIRRPLTRPTKSLNELMMSSIDREAARINRRNARVR